MNNNLLDGKKLALKLEKKFKKDVTVLTEKYMPPGLATILVGDDPASYTYVQMKKRACERLGIYNELHSLDKTIPEKELIDIIIKLNKQDNIHGILVQLPLPEHIDCKTIINCIEPEKDVDGFHPYNMGRLAVNKPLFIPCTPLGVMELMKEYKIKIKSKNIVVVGCSNIVGKPLGLQLLMCESATVTLCHVLTKNLKQHTLIADILISAVGKPCLITEDMVKDNAIIIDIGFNRNADNTICGDVDFDNVSKKASYITPVPGGVGPMTIAMLMKNTIESCKNHYLKK